MRMQGTVKWGANAGEFGYLTDSATGHDYRFYFTDVEKDGFVWLVPGERVSFETAVRKGVKMATKVRSEGSKDVVKTSSHEPVTMNRLRSLGSDSKSRTNRVVDLQANARGALTVLGSDGKPVAAHLECPGLFRVYHTGTVVFNFARVNYSRGIDRERGGLFVLDQEKVLRHAIAPGAVCDNVAPKSLFMVVRNDGMVRLTRLAWRMQKAPPGVPSQYYLILELVFECRFDLDRASEDGYLLGEIRKQKLMNGAEKFARSIEGALEVKTNAVERWQREVSAGH